MGISLTKSQSVAGEFCPIIFVNIAFLFSRVRGREGFVIEDYIEAFNQPIDILPD
jgi:hypothetical protein